MIINASNIPPYNTYPGRYNTTIPTIVLQTANEVFKTDTSFPPMILFSDS